VSRTAPGPAGPPDDGADLHLDLDLDLDLPPAPEPSRPPRRRRGRRTRVLAVLAGVLVVAVLVTAGVARQHQQVAAAAAERTAAARAAADARIREEAEDRDETRRQAELAARAALPEDLGFDQRLFEEALAGAAPRLGPLAWSRAVTSTVRDPSQRTGDGFPRLVDASRSAGRPDEQLGQAGQAVAPPVQVGAPAGAATWGPVDGEPATRVAWRLTTPLRAPTGADLDPCTAASAVPVPDGSDGQPVPSCSLRTATSPSGEQQVVAVRSWQRVVAGRPWGPQAQVQTFHLAVLVVEDRWTFSVAATAVGPPGSAAALPPLGLDQAALAVRWAADAARGRPTPAPLTGTPLPGFSG